MKIEHLAIWTRQLELLKNYYITHFNATANSIYKNPDSGFSSYFLSFDSGARLELMHMPGIPENKNDVAGRQHLGLIHMAFGMDSVAAVDRKAVALKQAGFPILKGPRRTGDGYYEFETLDPDGNRLEVSALFHE